jgi:GNAT superfamily N-acetyltransferase
VDVIREATCEDLPELTVLARSFAAATRWYGELNALHFCIVWEQLLESGAGSAWVLVRDGTIVGAIGGIAFPDMFSGDLVATEAFWFVRPDEGRGGGVRLYRALEHWACERGCVRLRMAHLTNSMPERVAQMYRLMKFEAVETMYQKEL